MSDIKTDVTAVVFDDNLIEDSIVRTTAVDSILASTAPTIAESADGRMDAVVSAGNANVTDMVSGAIDNMVATLTDSDDWELDELGQGYRHARSVGRGIRQVKNLTRNDATDTTSALNPTSSSGGATSPPAPSPSVQSAMPARWSAPHPTGMGGTHASNFEGVTAENLPYAAEDVGRTMPHAPAPAPEGGGTAFQSMSTRPVDASAPSVGQSSASVTQNPSGISGADATHIAKTMHPTDAGFTSPVSKAGGVTPSGGELATSAAPASPAPRVQAPSPVQPTSAPALPQPLSSASSWASTPPVGSAAPSVSPTAAVAPGTSSAASAAPAVPSASYASLSSVGTAHQATVLQTSLGTTMSTTGTAGGASAATAASATTAGGASVGAAGAGGSAAGAGVGAGAGVIIGIVALVIIIVVGCLLGLVLLSAGIDDEMNRIRVDGMSEDEAIVARYLADLGLEPVQIAAIMGNISAESGFTFASVEVGSGMGHGIMQWTGDPGRWRALQDLAAEMGRPWQSPEVQLELLKRELHVQWTSYTARDTFFETDSVEEATRLFCTYWVRPGIPRLDIRTEAAWRYYIIMVMYSPDGSDAQMRVVTAASAGSMYGAGVNECQKWVDEVYRACGYSFSAQPSASHARLAWSVSTDISTMPPGSVIFSGPDYHSGVYVGGLDAGHVGIYLGNGLVANNRNGSTVSIDTLEWWTAAFGYGGWGFPCQL